MTCTVQEEGGLEGIHVMHTFICTVIIPSFLHVIFRLRFIMMILACLAQDKKKSFFIVCFGGNPQIKFSFVSVGSCSSSGAW